MDNTQLKVLLVDHRKMNKRLLMAIFIYLVLYGVFVFSIFHFNPSKDIFLTLLIALLLLIPILPYLLMRSAYYREVISLEERAISTIQFGRIDLETIVKIKYGGNSTAPVIKIKLKNDFKLMIMSPYRNIFFTKDKIFDFYLAILRNSRLLNSTQKQG